MSDRGSSSSLVSLFTAASGKWKGTKIDPGATRVVILASVSMWAALVTVGRVAQYSLRSRLPGK